MKELEKIVDSNGEPLEIVDAEAREDISEIKQSLSQLDGLIIYKDLTPTDDYAEFNDGSNLPLISLISTIEPIQSGSGTPSPDNPRSISGHTDIDIIVSPNSDFSGGTTYRVNFVDGGNPLSVYGGTLDVISGVLTVDREFNTFTELPSQYADVGNDIVCAFIQSNNMKANSRNDGLSNYFSPTTTIIGQNNPWRVCFGINNKRIYFTFDPEVIGGNTLQNINNYVAINPIQVVYPLATPITYQLNPTQVSSLLGQNYISSDVGDITNVKYLGILNLS